MSDWILCSERLPDDGDSVLVTIRFELIYEFGNGGSRERPHSYTDFARYVGGRWENYDGGQLDLGDWVIAWRPLPNPYKEKELGPCPVCGSERVHIARAYTHKNGASWYRLECESCREKGPFYSDKESAIEAWNRRISNG